MGLFLSLSGIVGSSSKEVQDALKAYAQEKSGGFEITEGTTDNPDIGVITRDAPNTSIFYPAGFMNWDEASQYLSQSLSKPVFSFHIHDGDFWMYVLFDKGQEVDCFNPVPEYWHELPSDEKEQWRGNPQVITSIIPDVSSDSISKYLVEWDPKQEQQEKAYPDDKFSILDCWQMCDFMRKIGLQYPIPDEGPILGDTFKLWTEDCPLEDTYTDCQNKESKIPWWRFWQI
jgi:hypothetical protein